MNKNFAEIIPLRRLVRKLTVFDYQIPSSLQKQIQVGQLVQISFQKTDFLGVVIKIKEKTSISQKRLKAITKIVQKKPVITPEQFKLLDWMSNYYFLAPSTILKSMIPDFPRKPFVIYSKKNPTEKFSVKIPNKLVPWLTKEVNNFLQRSEKLISLNYPQKSVLFAFYSGIIRKIVTANKTMLILAPEIQELNRLYSLLAAKTATNKIAIVHSGLSSREYLLQWQKVLKNEAKIIMGTRLACFLPFSKLDVIVVHLEEDENHKQADQNPRFHVREVAGQLARYYNSRILFTNQTPSLEIFQEQKKGTIKTINPPLFPGPKITLISQEEELRKKNYSGISEDLQKLISKTLKQNRSVFLFLNRRGVAGAFVCQDCGWMARCPECLLPFTVHEKNFFVCHHCGQKKPLLLQCPHCQGSNLRPVGKGTQRLELELKKLFLNASVHRIDKDAPKKGSLSGIVIGTEYALRHLFLPDWGAIGIVSADNLFYLPDFRAEEKTYQLINRIIHFAANPVPVIIQTFSPENKSIQAVVKQDFIGFAQKELALRKQLHWPPYWQIVKLIYQEKNAKTALKEADKLVNQLKNKISKNDSMEIIGPIPAHRPQVRGKYQWRIIIKTKENHLKSLNKLIKSVPEDWIIDVDPVTLL